jgi:hypothetical protein
MPQQATIQQEAPAQASTDTIQQESPALAKLLESIALVGTLVVNSRLRARKSAIKVRGGRARVCTASRDERGRFVVGSPKAGERD